MGALLIFVHNVGRVLDIWLSPQENGSVGDNAESLLLTMGLNGIPSLMNQKLQYETMVKSYIIVNNP